MSDTLLEQAKRALAGGDAEQAWVLTQQAVEQAPDNIETLYLSAVLCRLRGDLRQAHVQLDALLAIRPGFGRAHQERGHCFRTEGKREPAVAAYEKAVSCNPLLTASWQLLEAHYRQADPAKAREAKDKIAEVEAMPLELRAALAAYYDEDFALAEERVRSFLMQVPDHPAAMRLLAELGTRMGEYEDAQFILEKCKELNPGYLQARFDLADVLGKRFHYEHALREAEELVSVESQNPNFLMLRANLLLQTGETDLALQEYQTLHDREGDNIRVSLTLGHALKALGRIEEAISAYRQTYGLKPDFGDAYWSLANLKTYRFTDGELGSMISEEANPAIDRDDRIHLCFALGKALEDRGDFARSFEYYARGNALRQEVVGYRAAAVTREIDEQIAHCTSGLFAAKSGSGCVSEDPIFIVGLPRAGSTLLEQILASHSMVEGTTELPDIMAIASRLNGRQEQSEADRYPGNLAELSVEELGALGSGYIKSTQVHRREGKPRFIDKMPNNFRHIGLIHLILPNARIIDARRDPMDCGFSVFKQLFAQGQDFSYDLDHIGRYYRDYVRLMDHWDTVLPGRVLRVQHEDVLDDLEGQVRRILDYCGLPFEQSCVEFHRTERAVRTPSSEQVRRPINRDGAGVWKNFEPWLDPLKTALAGQLA
ncbi:tetratricopeptide repeat-containing sulfotransferase family protein [Aquisediminimonas profunda]|uniref:tetratricopeptide repeat-containing sulfotransferase family protein n=1 Tax=Aquisediminimonas profunda TaxID=1550733 RepID=UPI001C62BE09|nr:tetratricopeptide repeat-containing sulfotransferase family protein [Aquisediminimonas profunda]